MSKRRFFPRANAQEIGAQLRQLRLESGFSPQDIEARLHIKTRKLEKIENGPYLPLCLLMRLIKFYGKEMHVVLK